MTPLVQSQYAAPSRVSSLCAYGEVFNFTCGERQVEGFGIEAMCKCE